MQLQLVKNRCTYSMRLRESLHFLPNCGWVYRSGSGGSNPACHSVIRFPAGRMECPQWSSWRLLQRWTLRRSLSHTAATYIYHVGTAIPLPPKKRQTLKSNKGEEKQPNQAYKQKYIIWADGLKEFMKFYTFYCSGTKFTHPRHRCIKVYIKIACLRLFLQKKVITTSIKFQNTWIRTFFSFHFSH